MPVYSNSKLSIYENCPQQYKLTYIEPVEVPEGIEGIEAFLGSRVHETLEKLYRELILTKLNTLEDLVQYYEEQWDKKWNKDIAIKKTEYTKEHYHDTGIKAITHYYKRHFPFNQSTTLATEYLITFKIDNYTIRGYIDRLSHRGKGNYEIHDYKTSGTSPSQNWFDNNRQLALYQIGVKEKFRNARDVRLIWHYLVFDEEFTSIRTDAQIRDLKKEIVSLIKTIEKDTKFEPKESNLCGWCDFPEYCPAKKHEAKVQDLSVNKYLKEKGVSLVNKYASIKAKMKELKGQEQELNEELTLIEEAAIKYAQKEGISNITGSDFMLKIAEYKRLDFPHADDEDREELEKYIKKVGIWEEVSGLNTTRLAKMIEDKELDNKIKNGLLKFAEEDNKLKVRLVKKREEEK